jgi:hypothetical protein
VGEDIKKYVRRVVQVWRDRRIYPESFLAKLELKAALGNPKTERPPPDQNQERVVVPEMVNMIDIAQTTGRAV